MTKRLMTGVAAVALVMGGMALFGAFSAGATGTPTITITPSTGLVDMQSVQITGTGFAPNLGLGSTVAVECLTAATSASGCDVTDYGLVTSDASGNVNFAFVVHAGTIGNGTCGTSTTDATCKISIASYPSSVVLATGPITFASGGTTTTTATTTTTTPTTTTTTPTTTTTTPTTTTTTPTTTTTTPTTTTAPATTTTAPATTTTTPTTTTTAAPRPAPRATKTTGTAIPGETVVITVWGSHFTAVSRVSGPAGATISVKSVTASKLTLKIKEAANAKKGSFTLTIHFKSGKTATVKYTVK